MAKGGGRPKRNDDLSFLGCLGVFAGIIGLIVFLGIASAFLVDLRGSSSSDAAFGSDRVPLYIAGPLTALAVVLVPLAVQRFARKNAGQFGSGTGRRKGSYTSRVPLWVRGTGLLPILFLLPVLVAGGPPRPTSHFQHAFTLPEAAIATLGIAVSVPPILAAIGGRALPLAGTMLFWLGWAVAVLLGQYGWALAATVAGLVFSGIMLWLYARKPHPAPGIPRGSKG